MSEAVIINEDGSFAEGWSDSLPEEIRGNESISGAKSLSDLAGLAARSSETKSPETFGDLLQFAPDEYKDAKTWEKFKGTDMPTALKTIVDMDRYTGKKGDIPPEDATPEQRAEFWNKLGADNIELSEIELGEEFGDSAQELKPYYNGIKDAVLEIAKSAIPTAKNIPDLLNKIVTTFIEQDSKATLKNGVEAQANAEKAMNDVAGKLGMDADGLKQMNDEVMKRFGWDEKTHFSEVLHKLHTEVGNSKTLKDNLTSTTPGKQARATEILSDPDFWNKTPENAARHNALVEEHTKLFDELNKSS